MLRCDTGLASEAGAALTPATLRGLPPVLGLINSGGVLADAIFMSQTAGKVRAVFAPKLASTAAMRSAAAAQPVEQLLLFSSAAALFGAPGQANYAAANAALEGWASAAASAGVSSVAIQWGAWAAGMADDKVVMQRAARTGLGLLQPQQALDVLGAVMLGRGAAALVAAVPVTWATLLKVNKAEPALVLRDRGAFLRKGTRHGTCVDLPCFCFCREARGRCPLSSPSLPRPSRCRRLRAAARARGTSAGPLRRPPSTSPLPPLPLCWRRGSALWARRWTLSSR
jgi:hypothetical protein